MSNSPDISRRDWFRLRLPKQDQWLGDAKEAQKAVQNATAGLQSIEHPPNHDGMNLADLPPLREATLSREEVSSLLDDIHNCGSDIQLMQRRGPANSRASVDTLSNLSIAKNRFLDGSVKRLQIRYRWQGSLWIDTLERQELSTRLVRVAHRGM